MNFENHMPIYLQIINLIKRDLILGKRAPGDKLESVREYAVILKVNPNTVQKAYQEMERMGLAYSQRGIGRFIVDDQTLVSKLRQEQSNDVISDFVQKMKNVGYSDQEIIKMVEDYLRRKS